MPRGTGMSPTRRRKRKSQNTEADTETVIAWWKYRLGAGPCPVANFREDNPYR